MRRTRERWRIVGSALTDPAEKKRPVLLLFIFFPLFRDQQSEYWVLYELMCWLANCRGEVPSSEEISVVDSIIF
jgi:hypothetical protein